MGLPSFDPDAILLSMTIDEEAAMAGEGASKGGKYEGFSGVISLYDGEETLELLCRGSSNIAAGCPNDGLTSFGMASGSKIFTAVGILRLVEGGAFTLDAPVNGLIGRYRVHDAITVRQLLSHRSGIPDYFDEETMDDYEELWRERPNYGMLSPEDFLPLFVDRENKFEPGSRFSYSNSGFVLLAYIIERATGEPFPGYIRESIFERCAMGATGYFRLDKQPPNTAVGYIPEGECYRSNIYSIPVVGGGDGGCFSCGRDMGRFWRALLGGSLLEPATVDRMLAISVEDTGEEADRYGLGVWISASDPDTVFVQGFDPGVAFLSYCRRDSGRVLSICSNTGYRLGPIASDYIPRLG
jgi:CubicO group peptidase (beta-lactamase class C family)